MENTASRWEPDDDEYESASAELKERFATWAANAGVAIDHDVPEGLLHYKWAYVDGHLTRWTRRDLSEIYLELYPAKVMADPDELDEVLAEARAFLTFLSAPGLLEEESESVEVLIDHLATALASAYGPRPQPKAYGPTTPLRSRPSWRALTPGPEPSGTRSSERVGRRGAAAHRRAGSLLREPRPDPVQESGASAGDERPGSGGQ